MWMIDRWNIMEELKLSKERIYNALCVSDNDILIAVRFKGG